jgi:membrane fusion protein (multidrug efflux system)
MLKNIKTPHFIIFGISSLFLLGIYFFYFLNSTVSTDNAYLKADITVLSPRVSGYITSVTVQDNEKIEMGKPIAIIDQRDFIARLDQAKAQVDSMSAQIQNLENQQKNQQARIRQAQAGIDAAQANFVKSQKEFTRAEALARGGAIARQVLENVTADYKNSKASLDKSKAELEGAQNQLDALQAQIAQSQALLKNAEAALELAQIDLEHTVIRAPRGGIVGNKNAQVGQLVRPGVALAYLIPTDTIWVEANFKESQIDRIFPGQPATIKVDAYPRQEFKGVVESLSPASGAEFSILPPENATGNFTKVIRRVPVKIVFNKGTDMSILKPGLSTMVTIKLIQPEAL